MTGASIPRSKERAVPRYRRLSLEDLSSRTWTARCSLILALLFRRLAGFYDNNFDLESDGRSEATTDQKRGQSFRRAETQFQACPVRQTFFRFDIKAIMHGLVSALSRMQCKASQSVLELCTYPAFNSVSSLISVDLMHDSRNVLPILTRHSAQ